MFTKLLTLSDEMKCLIALAMVIIMGFVLFITYTIPDEPINDHEGIIRLHIIANSDSAEDQNLKLAVRNEIIRYMTSSLQSSNISSSVISDEDISATRQFIKSNLNALESIAATQIQADGYNYNVTASLGICYIPEKSYGDITFPAGNYEALNITIGSGQGQNWWCVLFPPLCILDEGSEELSMDGLEEEEKLQLKWKLLDVLN